MKRIGKLGIIVILIGVCIFGTSCNKTKIKEKSDPAVTTSTEGEEKESSTSKDETAKDGEHPFNSYEDLKSKALVDISAVDYGFDFPGLVLGCGSGRSHCNVNDFVIVCNQYMGADMTTPEDGITIENITSSDVVLEEMKKNVIGTAGSEVALGLEDMTITSKKKVEVNGWDMCRYEGKLIRSEADAKILRVSLIEFNFIAYTVIKDECPIYLIVFDTSDDQSGADLIAETADKVATTFRENEYEGQY